MATALTTAIYFNFIHARIGMTPLQNWQILLITIGLTTTTWLVVTLFTRPASETTLRRFYKKVRPGGPGWNAVRQRAREDGEPLPETPGGWDVPTGLLCAALGCIMIYSALFSTGYWIYGKTLPALVLTVLGIASGVVLLKFTRRLHFQQLDAEEGKPDQVAPPKPASG